MSEGIQGQKAIEEEELANSSQQQQQQGQRGGGGNPLVLGIDQGPRARKAALLVQAYGRTPQADNSWGANSDTLFVSFIRNLVSRIRKFIRICHFFLPPTPSTKVRLHKSLTTTGVVFTLLVRYIRYKETPLTR